LGFDLQRWSKVFKVIKVFFLICWQLKKSSLFKYFWPPLYISCYQMLTFQPLWFADNDSDRRLLLWIGPSGCLCCLCLIWNSNGDKVHSISLDLLYLFPGPPFLRRIWQMPKIVKCCGQFVGSKGSGTRRAYLMVFKGDQEIQIPTFWDSTNWASAGLEVNQGDKSQ